MFTQTKSRGKFELNRSELEARVVYEASIDGCADEVGSVDQNGRWYGYVKGRKHGWILEEDSAGFVWLHYSMCTFRDCEKEMEALREALDDEYYDDDPLP